jgi:uncharacterized protein (TIGR02300 family)
MKFAFDTPLWTWQLAALNFKFARRRTPVAKPEWGKKRTCQSCGAKYYDLQKETPTCPKCETVFQVETPQRGRRSRAAVETPKVVPLPVPAAAAMTEEVSDIADDDIEVDTLDGDDESLPEDTSDLVDDDEDVSDVIVPVENEGDDG